MAAVTAAVVGGVAAVGSAAASIKGARNQEKALRDAQRRAENLQFTPFSLFGPGGQTVQFGNTAPVGPGGQPIDVLPSHPGNLVTFTPPGAPGGFPFNPANFNAGAATGGPAVSTSLGPELDPAFSGLIDFANQRLGAAADPTGLPPAIAEALERANQTTQDFPGIDLRTLNTLATGAGGVFDTSLGALGDAFGPFLPELQDTAFGGATNLAAIAGQDPQAIAQQRLDLLREQARPFEERAFANLQDNLFSTGRLGTTGGSLQTEAFARGLGQADLSRQIAASAEGRAFQNQALTGARNLTTLGTGVRSLEEDLLSGAFRRFDSTAGLVSDISDTRVSRLGALNALRRSGAQADLANAFRAATFERGLSSQDLNLALQALEGQGGLNTQALANLQASLAPAIATANVEAGAATNLSNLAISGNFGAQQDALASAFGAIAGNLPPITNLFQRQPEGPNLLSVDDITDLSQIS